MSTNEGRPVTAREDVRKLWRELRLEVWFLRMILRLFRRRLGTIDSWRRTHGLSLLHYELLRSQGVVCGMWGWADYPRLGESAPIIHTSSYASPAFFLQNYDYVLASTLESIHRMLATEVMEQIELVQNERAKV